MSQAVDDYVRPGLSFKDRLQEQGPSDTAAGGGGDQLSAAVQDVVQPGVSFKDRLKTGMQEQQVGGDVAGRDQDAPGEAESHRASVRHFTLACRVNHSAATAASPSC